MFCRIHQLWCIITLKPFDDHHNHREDHKNTRNVVLQSFRGMNVRIYTLIFLRMHMTRMNRNSRACKEDEEEDFKRMNYRQGKTHKLQMKMRLYG